MAPVHDPVLIGGRWWLWPDGRILPLVAGAQDAGDGGQGQGEPGQGEPAQGGQPQGQGQPPATDAGQPPQPPEAGDLGDAGKRALEAERRRAREAERRAREAEAERDRLKQQNETEQERVVREATEAARREERERAIRRIVAAEVKARAGGKLADPEDAVRFLDASRFTVSDEGEVDPSEIDSAIEDLLNQKPYLKAAGQIPPKPPSVDGGARPPASDRKTNIEDRLKRIKEHTGIQ